MPHYGNAGCIMQDADCKADGIELKQTLTVVFSTELSTNANVKNFQSKLLAWSQVISEI